MLSPHVIQIIRRNFAFKTRQTFIRTPTHNATTLCVSAFYCLTPLICQNMIRYKTPRWLEQAASSSISLNKYQANEWILNSHCRLYHKTDLCFISFRHLQTLFRKMRATCSNKIFPHSFFTFFFFFTHTHFVSSPSLPRLPCLITESIKKAIKHHAGNMYNPLNKSWIKYANSNNGMLISVPFCLHYWFSRVRARPWVHKWHVAWF